MGALGNLLGDIRYGVRTLGRNPGFALAAIATIALGVGVNTGIFSVLNGVLFRDLPATDAGELVSISQAVDGVPDRLGGGPFSFSTSEYGTYRDRTQSLAGLLGYSDPWQTMLGGESPEAVIGLLVTCNYFDVLGTPPIMGRGLTARDCETGADLAVVLGYELWVTSFDSDPAIVGRTIELNRQLATVVGVAAEGTYGGTYEAAYFGPISAQPLLNPVWSFYQDDQRGWLAVVGRRAAGVSTEQVRAELDVIAAQIDGDQPGRSTALTIQRATPMVVPVLLYPELVLGATALLMAPFVLILLIACANVANLLLARATARTHDIAVRLSLGASRWRIVRQLMTESMLIAVAGGVVGSVLALWSFQVVVALALPSLSPPGIPPLALDLSPDFRVLSFALLLALATGIVFGLAPAFRLSKPDLNAVIKQDGAAAGASRRGGRLRGALVGVQVAMCMLLMLTAGLLLRGSYATQTIDPGFDYDDVVYMPYDLERAAGYTEQQAAQFRDRLMERLVALPSVESAANALEPPLSDGGRSGLFRLPGQSPEGWRLGGLNAVTSDYFSVLDIPIVNGRTFTADEVTSADAESESGIAIVSESTARKFWPGADPLGQTIVSYRGTDSEIALRVVGVARDAQVGSLGTIDPYYVYLPAVASFQDVLLVRSRLDFASTVADIRAAVRTLDPSISPRVSPLAVNVNWWRGLSGMVTTIAAASGTVALLLAAVGIFAVVSYYVSNRLREIGIRMALGAASHDVLALILRQTMRPVVVGALVGIAAALGVSGVLSSVLFGVSPFDPIGLGGGLVFVLLVAFLATILPARRGLRVDPMTTLRYE